MFTGITVNQEYTDSATGYLFYKILLIHFILNGLCLLALNIDFSNKFATGYQRAN